MPHQLLYNKIFTEQAAITNPRKFLEDIVNEYPYFSLAHFFLLKETANTDFNYRKIAAKTALHFNNPFLLKYQLNKKLGQDEKLNAIEDIPNAEPIEKNTSPIAIPTPPAIEQDETEEMTRGIQEIPDVQNAVENKQEAATIELNDSEKTAGMDIVTTNAEAGEQPGIESIKEIIPPATAPTNSAKKEELLFEPLHTSDYFASQGIKLSEEVQSGDKLGKQLRSFTDWLKTMKKVHNGKLPDVTSIDHVVQNMAEKSNKEQEVLTEAMAEVYVQQGKIEKAAEIYRKLSLLNPSKSAYFAAKLELLKEN